jgi:hypothetical protein
MLYWVERGSDCGVGFWLTAKHNHYESGDVNICPAPVGQVVIKLYPLPMTVAILPAAAAVALGGSQVLVSDVLYWDGAQRTGMVAGSWKLYAGPECGSITPDGGEQTTYAAPSSMPSASCDIAPPEHVWIYYTVHPGLLMEGGWTAKADLTLQP